ncbi:hypothetical protein [Zavarzinella formosa]|uniref:hypothetical protein n=1 Tax=Zavarzinella formosa TaxID=360055 RepID=UPI00031B6593|nr:hypothetical protein [Zavarzinella formosa]
MAKAKLGLLATLYRNTGTYEAPIWSPVTGISDFSVNPTMDEGDASGKGDGGLAASEPTLLHLEFTGKIREDESNGAFTVFENAFYGRTALDLLMLSGPKETVGSRGLRADFKFFNWTQDQGLPTVLFNDFTIKRVIGNPVQRAVINSTDVVTYTPVSVTAS